MKWFLSWLIGVLVMVSLMVGFVFLSSVYVDDDFCNKYFGNEICNIVDDKIVVCDGKVDLNNFFV